MAATEGAMPTKHSVSWKSAIWAGVIAGVVFMMMEMGLVALTGGSPWGPPRMIAAMAMGRDVLPPPASFDAVIMIIAMGIHIVLSIVLAIVFAFLAARLGMGMAVLAGAVFGLVIYLVNFYGFTALFPWFAMARNMISIVSHIAFGVVLALSYKLIAR
jgi:uncharacterized membrane protein YagU involved in acid resistance